MTLITIESMTEGYIITQGDDKIAISSPDKLVRKMKALMGITDKSNPDRPSKQKTNTVQKGQDPPREPPGSYHKEDKKPAVPAAKPGVTKSKVHTLLDDGLTTAEIAVKLKLTVAAIIYHEKSYVPKDVKDEIVYPDKSINADETPDELPDQSQTEDDQITIPAPSQQQTEPGEMTEFHELKITLPKHMLTKLYGDRRNTDKHNLTYYSNEEGGLIIQYGTNKCYTTWDELNRLPHPVPGEMLTNLNSHNKLGVKAFKNWMVRQADISKTEDPDADFRPMLTGVIDTSTNYDSKLDGVE